MPKAHSKRYTSALKVADLTKDYPLAEAVELLTKFPKAKFDETVELSFCLGVDATAGEQMVRGTTPLPNGSGKKVRVLVFTDDAPKAIAAGADAIVTFNLRDFPAAALSVHGIDALSPDTFLRYFASAMPHKLLESVRACFGRLNRPRATAADYLRALQRLGLNGTAAFLAANEGAWTNWNTNA